MERTLCIIKPHIINEDKVDDVIGLLKENGFNIIQEKKVIFEEHDLQYDNTITLKSTLINLLHKKNKLINLIGEIKGE